jgi:hypothetical protein
MVMNSLRKNLNQKIIHRDVNLQRRMFNQDLQEKWKWMWDRNRHMSLSLFEQV